MDPACSHELTLSCIACVVYLPPTSRVWVMVSRIARRVDNEGESSTFALR
jgi:hypothetical protein